MRVHVGAAAVLAALLAAPAALAQDLRPDDVLARVKRSGVLRWGADATGGAPYVFLDTRNANRNVGFELEIANAIAGKLGVRAELVQGNYDKLLDLLARGDFDVAINGIEANQEKLRVCELSKSYYIAGETLAVRAKDGWLPKSLAELKGRKIGTLPSTLAERLLKESLAEVATYDGGLAEVYKDLALGRTDGVLIDQPTAIYFAPIEPGLVMVPRSFGQVSYAVATAKGEKTLVAAIDVAIEELKRDGTLRAIYERWGIWNADTAVLFGEADVAPRTKAVAYDEWLSSAPTSGFLERVKTYPRYLPQLLKGAGLTLAVSLAAFALAVVLGVTLALTRRYGPWPLRTLAAVYIEVFRGTPLLVQLFFIYFGLPELGIPLAPWVAAILGLGMNYAAAEAENYRAGLESVPAAQIEACWSLGLTTLQAVRYVVVPQAIRVAIPPATNDFIALLKDSSLVSAITMNELLRESQTLASATRDSRGIFLLCALIYLLMGLPFAHLARYVEKRMASHLRRVDT